jgi:tetratricopeptide (TPR) repeat protein
MSAWERYRQLWLDLEAHAEKHPDDPAGWRALARAMEEWRDYAGALKAYDRLAALLPQDLDIQARRGRMLFYLRNPEAEAVLARVVAARPGDAKSRSLLALLRYRPSPGSQPDVTSSLTELDLSNTDLRGRLFKQVDFSGSDFSGADLRYTYLEEVNFARANLSRAQFFDGFPFYSDIYVTSLRNADFTGSFVEDIPPAADYSGIKLSGVTVPANAFLGGDLKWVMQADLTGARIGCTALANAEWWRKTGLSSEETGYRRERWQDHLDELKQAQRVVQEHPAALLDASCSEAIQNHVHDNCAPWIAKADRPPACKIDF